ncbi:hypothetical protein SAHL_13365 [Salinisphaera orenii YIM 95161]|uniref:Putative Flp pilus-assembly TadG-like N-terminal domain-containing protein n=2 Tax=Salinisphaera TaxID=180541 RepID=A0A423PKC3_9GAMM|nr:hypothetical protein SAHL_13365 [Salinisphaera halophila YIM 95161]
MTAAFIVAAVALLALAIDTGRLYAAQARLQSAANLATLDAARAISACGIGEPDDRQAAAEAAVDSSLSRNFGTDSDKVTSTTDLGVRITEADLYGFRSTEQLSADSARVTLSRPPPKRLLGALEDEPVELSATAAAISQPTASISAGSTLLDIGGVDGTDGLLSALLGGPVGLDVASYKGLAESDITIADLIDVDARIASLDELLETELSLPAALDLLAGALNTTTGGVDDVAAEALGTLADVADPNRKVVFGDVLNIETGLENTLDALPINAADLLTGLAQAANTGSPISLRSRIDLGGIAKVAAEINIIEPRQIDVGRAGQDENGNFRTVASTGQANIQLNIEVLGALPEELGGALITLPVFIKAASAEARLKDIICAGPSKPFSPENEHTVELETDTAVATIGIGEFENIDRIDPEPADEVTLVNAVVAQVVTDSLTVNLGSAGCVDYGTENIVFDGPFPPESGAERRTDRVGVPLTDALNCGLTRLSSQLFEPGTLEVRVLGACIPILCQVTSSLLAPVVGTVITLLRPVLDLLGTALLDPLFRLLGLSVGTADVSVNGVVANNPRLFCTSRETCGLAGASQND